MDPLADPFTIRLSTSQISYLDTLLQRRGMVTRVAAIRYLIDNARAMDPAAQQQQEPALPARPPSASWRPASPTTAPSPAAAPANGHGAARPPRCSTW